MEEDGDDDVAHDDDDDDDNEAVDVAPGARAGCCRCCCCREQSQFEAVEVFGRPRPRQLVVALDANECVCVFVCVAERP